MAKEKKEKNFDDISITNVLITISIIVVLFLILLYSIGVFIEQSFDLFQWRKTLRIVLVVVWNFFLAMVAIGGGGLIEDIKNNIKKNMEKISIEKSKEPDYWVVTHKEAQIVVKFKQGDFNGTQKVTPLKDFDPNEFMKIAKYMQEIGNFLVQNHKDKI